MTVGNSSFREDPERTVKQMLLSRMGISHRHGLFSHYFVIYNELLRSEIGTLVMY